MPVVYWGDIQLYDVLFLVYGGDIILTPEQRELVDGSSSPRGRFYARISAVRGGFYRWPNGVVPYLLERHLNSKFHQLSTGSPPLAVSILAQ